MKRILLVSFVLLFTLSGTAWAQRTVSGEITDNNGDPLPGVSVVIKSTGQGQITNANGQYRIEVPNDQTILVFSFIGLKTQEIVVGARSAIDVVMEEDVTQLQEVVITGYGDIDKRTLTGSATTVDTKQIEQVPLGSFDQMLQGSAPGVLVRSGSGQPGAQANVLIRGVATFEGGTAPLYVIDGVRVSAADFESLNSNDIESINLLKDATSTALYGASGTNGVIVITTKRGKRDGTTVVRLSAQAGFSEPTRRPVEMMNAAQKLRYERDNQSGVGHVGTGSAAAPIPYTDAQIDSVAQFGVDWLDEVFRDRASFRNYELSMSGGNEKTSIYASLAYFDQEGILLNSRLRRGTARLNFSHSATDWLTIRNNVTIGFARSSFIDGAGAVYVGNPVVQSLLNAPYEPVFDPETGEYNLPTFGFNAVQEALINDFDNDQTRILNTFTLEAAVTDNITLISRSGVDLRTNVGNRYDAPGSYRAGIANSNGLQGYIDNSWGRRVGLTLTNMARYDKVFGGKHDVEVSLGTEFNRIRSESFSVEAQGFANELLRNIASAAEPVDIGGGSSESALLSYFALGQYSYDGKYNFTASFRVDGSSRFGVDNRFAPFWAVGASWNLHEEDFLSGIGVIDQLRIKANFGSQGNQPTALYANRALYGFGSSYNGQNGSTPVQLENAGLRWESQNLTEIGLDFSLFNSRLDAQITWYNRVTDRLLLGSPLSASTGFNDFNDNVGSLRNRGFEFLVNLDVVRSNGFIWGISANAALNQNEVLQLVPRNGNEDIITGSTIQRVGEPAQSYFDVQYAGVNPANGQPMYYTADGQLVPDALFDDNEAVVFAQSIPPRSGGFTNRFTYKGFELSALFTWQEGNRLLNNNNFFIESSGQFNQFNQTVRMLDEWRQPGDITDVPAFGSANRFSTRQLEDASFLRLRNVVLRYTLPKNWLSSLNISSFSVFAQGQNLLTFTRYTGPDPEFSGSVNGFEFPLARTYTFGVDMSF